MRARGTQAKFQVRPEHVALETPRGIIGNLLFYLHVVKCDPSVLCKLLTEDGNLGIALAEVI